MLFSYGCHSMGAESQAPRNTKVPQMTRPHVGVGRAGRPKAAAAGPLALVALAAAIAACQPTVKVEAPKDPITINLNIQADVRVTLEEAAKEDIAANPNLF